VPDRHGAGELHGGGKPLHGTSRLLTALLVATSDHSSSARHCETDHFNPFLDGTPSRRTAVHDTPRRQTKAFRSKSRQCSATKHRTPKHVTAGQYSTTRQNHCAPILEFGPGHLTATHATPRSHSSSSKSNAQLEAKTNHWRITAQLVANARPARPPLDAMTSQLGPSHVSATHGKTVLDARSHPARSRLFTTRRHAGTTHSKAFHSSTPGQLQTKQDEPLHNSTPWHVSQHHSISRRQNKTPRFGTTPPIAQLDASAKRA